MSEKKYVRIVDDDVHIPMGEVCEIINETTNLIRLRRSSKNESWIYKTDGGSWFEYVDVEPVKKTDYKWVRVLDEGIRTKQGEVYPVDELLNMGIYVRGGHGELSAIGAGRVFFDNDSEGERFEYVDRPKRVKIIDAYPLLQVGETYEIVDESEVSIYVVSEDIKTNIWKNRVGKTFEYVKDRPKRVRIIGAKSCIPVGGVYDIVDFCEENGQIYLQHSYTVNTMNEDEWFVYHDCPCDEHVDNVCEWDEAKSEKTIDRRFAVDIISSLGIPNHLLGDPNWRGVSHDPDSVTIDGKKKNRRSRKELKAEIKKLRKVAEVANDLTRAISNTPNLLNWQSSQVDPLILALINAGYGEKY